MNIMAHTKFTPSNLLVSCEVVIRTCAVESFATSASAKQKPVHYSGLFARNSARRLPTWTLAQYFHQNTKHEATPSVKTRVSNIPKESPGRRHEHHSLDNWKRLKHQAPGDRLLQKTLQVKRKFHLHPSTDGEKYIRKFDDLAMNFKPQSEEERDISQSSIEQHMCKSW